MSSQFPANARIAPERWYGEKLGHLSRHDRVALLRGEVHALCAEAGKRLNVFAIRKSFLNAGGKEEHWRQISEHLSVLHPLAPVGPGKPALRISASSEGAGRPGTQADNGSPRSEHSYRRLGKILVERGIITAGQLERAVGQQLRTGERLGSILVATGTVDPHELAQALAAQTGLLAVDLDRYPVEPAAGELLPVELCERHCMLPVTESGDMVMLAMGNPADADAYTASREALAGKRVRRVVAAEMQIEKRLRERKHAVGSSR